MGANNTNQQLRNLENSSLHGEAEQSYSSLILSTESLGFDVVTARVRKFLPGSGIYCLCMLYILNRYLDSNNWLWCEDQNSGQGMGEERKSQMVLKSFTVELLTQHYSDNY